MINVLIPRGNLDTGRHTERAPCEGEGRDQGEAPVSQECQRVQANRQKIGEGHGTDPSLSPQKEVTQTPISNFSPIEL